MLSRVHREESQSSDKNCSFRSEVGTFDEKSSFQDKHRRSLNRARGWLCPSSLFSFFSGLLDRVRLIYLSEPTLMAAQVSRPKVFFSIGVMVLLPK